MKVQHTKNGNVKVTMDLETAEVLRAYLDHEVPNWMFDDAWATLGNIKDALAEAGVEEGPL